MQPINWRRREVDIFYRGMRIARLSRGHAYESYVLDINQELMCEAIKQGLDPMYIDGNVWIRLKKFPKRITYGGPWYPDILLYRTPEYGITSNHIMEEYDIDFLRTDKNEYDRLDFLLKYYEGTTDETGLEFKEAVSKWD